MRATRVAILILASVAPALYAQGTPSVAHAKQQFDARNWDAARQEFAALARATPNDVTPVLYLGRIAMAQNDADESVKQFEQCVKIDDNNADCHAWLGNALGNTAMRASKFKLPFIAKRTKKEFDRAVELDPRNVDGRWGEMQYYMHAPGFLGGSMDKAREQAAEIDKYDKLRGALAYAALAENDKKTGDAEAAYQRAIVAAPDSLVGHFGLLNVYIREKRWHEAFGVLDRAAARLPAEHNILLAVARVAYLSGEQLPRGEEAAKSWIASPPKNASVNSQVTAHVRLGNIYEKTNRKELARTEYEKAVSLNPKLDDAKKALDGLR